MRTVFAFLAVFLLSGCSRIGLAYHYADWLIERQAQKYTNFDSAQKKVISAEVETYLAWHRQTMLPRYAAYLRETADKLKPEITDQDVKASFEQGLLLYAQTLEPLLPTAASLIHSLNPTQREIMSKRFKERDEELRESWKNREKYLKKRASQTLDAIENCTGSLSSAQADRVRQLSQALPWTADAWLKERELRQEKLLAQVELPAIESTLRAWVNRLASPLNTQDQALIHSSERAIGEMLVDSIHSLTPLQLVKCKAELAKVAGQLDKISKEH